MASLNYTSSYVYRESGNSSNYREGSFDPTDGVLTDNGNDNVYMFGELMFDNGSGIGTFNGTFTNSNGTWIVVQTAPPTGPNTGRWSVFSTEGNTGPPPNIIRESELDRGDYVTCFVAGTLIETDAGKRRVEDLQTGDLVLTESRGLQPIRWIGSRKLDAVDLAARPEFLPICIRAGALDKNVPARDLLVSPQHRMLLCGWQEELVFGEQSVLVAAKHLVNGKTIQQVQATEVEYFHILFDQHEMIFAEDACTESFHPGAYAIDGMAKNTREEIFGLFPELRNDVLEYGPTVRPTLKKFEYMALQAMSGR